MFRGSLPWEGEGGVWKVYNSGFPRPGNIPPPRRHTKPIRRYRLLLVSWQKPILAKKSAVRFVAPASNTRPNFPSRSVLYEPRLPSPWDKAPPVKVVCMCVCVRVCVCQARNLPVTHIKTGELQPEASVLYGTPNCQLGKQKGQAVFSIRKITDGR